jgi:two-component system, OmpR family, KDP operon response regulator KdpE
MKILLIEDDLTTIEAVRLALEVYNSDAQIEFADRGQTGLAMIKDCQFDVVVLDLGLPDIDGSQVLEELRSFSSVPVIVISARHDPKVITNALKQGATDYILKPFDIQILLSNLKDILRVKDASVQTEKTLRIAENVELDINDHKLIVKNRSIDLTPGERIVMDSLISNIGRIVTVESLTEKMASIGEKSDSVVHETVHKLRNIIGDDQYFPTIILPEYGCGYRLKRAN